MVWFLLGIAFLVLEAFVPGVFLLFFGLGAWSAALAALAGLNQTAQLLTFMAVSLVSLALLRKKLRALLTARAGRGEMTDDPVFAAQFLGREVAVVGEAAQGRLALVELNGSNWQAESEGEPLRLGDRVRVVALKNLVLVVTRIPTSTT
jgi:membrane protein implicated in regulation of membrane protease activity